MIVGLGVYPKNCGEGIDYSPISKSCNPGDQNIRYDSENGVERLNRNKPAILLI